MITNYIFLREDMFKASATTAAPSVPGFGSRPPVAPQVTGITFDRFVRACVVIKQLTEAFQKIDTDRVRLLERLTFNFGFSIDHVILTSPCTGWVDPNQLRSVHVHRPQCTLRMLRRGTSCTVLEACTFFLFLV